MPLSFRRLETMECSCMVDMFFFFSISQSAREAGEGVLTQVVVRGAGHLVPFDQPGRSIDMIKRWLGKGF